MDSKFLIGILVLIGLVISVVGCETAPPQTTPGDTTGPAAEEPPEEVPDVPAPVEVKLSQEIKDTLAKSDSVNYFQYVYQSTESSRYTSKHYAKGDKLRIHYDSFQKDGDFVYYDIYLDKSKGLAYLVCDDTVDCKGKKAKEVMFDSFNMETPLEIIAYIDNGEKVEDSEWDSKKAIVVSYVNKDEKSEKIWLWTYRGMPLKREISSGDSKIVITYNSLVVNPPQETPVDMPTGLEMV